ncbi:DUF2239 family protein [Montanilutibacter psychrotolerans]|uniref:DUF2239 family protein n=1 Tax=Montanilutibacter psychrotolerans TaxID=1327343 RepID=A0A3M8SWQ1_9GAMM|nr:DUF2239 family protein [Lysobacter psychrotolerans]RNF83132.1 DUF2239 family protein [Lysobacter psychrotolerans]
MNPPITCTAFSGVRRFASGSPADVAVAIKQAIDRGETATLLAFDDRSGTQLDFDLRGSVDDVRERAQARVDQTATANVAVGGDAEAAAAVPARGGPGRPKLGVVAREITLLPRHWQWLADQPGGASVTLRKLVEQARGAGTHRERQRRAQDAAYRFMSAMAGNEAGFEEASRALFAADGPRFDACIASWPVDVRELAQRLAAAAFLAVDQPA